jgi:hypothetical protein
MDKENILSNRQTDRQKETSDRARGAIRQVFMVHALHMTSVCVEEEKHINSREIYDLFP